MTDTTSSTRESDSAPWPKEEGDAMYYAARGLAEDDLQREAVVSRIMDARLGIAAGVAAALTVLHEGGWLRATPEVPLAETRIPGWAEQAKPVLAAWDADPQDGAIARPAPPNLAALLRSVVEGERRP
jgi:hypothetical protein